jgi:hypothetical protein
LVGRRESVEWIYLLVEEASRTAVTEVAPQYLQFDPQSKAQSLPIGVPPAELLQWAVAEGKRAIAGVLLVEHCHVARPAW